MPRQFITQNFSINRAPNPKDTALVYIKITCGRKLQDCPFFKNLGKQKNVIKITEFSKFGFHDTAYIRFETRISDKYLKYLSWRASQSFCKICPGRNQY